MNEKKKGIRQRIKDGWNNLDERGKGALIGSFISAFVTTFTAGIIMSKREDSYIQISNTMIDEESKMAYQRGIKDGQTKAYFELLTSPESAFRKMGMTDIKHF